MQSAAPQLPLFADDHDEPGTTPGFSVRESARAKRLSIKVFPRGRVEVVVPRRTPPAEVQAFVAENRDWIANAKASFAEQYEVEPFALPLSVELNALGCTVRVQYQRRHDSTSVRYRYGNGVLTLSGRTGDEKRCVTAIRRWLSATAKEELGKRLQALAALTGMTYDRLQVRAQRSCWGSRSSSGTISLNLCLLFLEPPLVRYLMIHELCHGRHMDHSRRFWKLVSRFEPDYRRLDRELLESWRNVPSWLGVY